MRFLIGIIVGVILTVGVAYIHDASLDGTDREARMLVNWPAFSTEMRDIREALSSGWDRLTGALPRRS